MHTYIEKKEKKIKKKNYSTTNVRGCILACLKKPTSKIIIYILLDVHRWVRLRGFCDGFGFSNATGRLRRRLTEGVQDFRQGWRRIHYGEGAEIFDDQSRRTIYRGGGDRNDTRGRPRL